MGVSENNNTMSHDRHHISSHCEKAQFHSSTNISNSSITSSTTSYQYDDVSSVSHRPSLPYLLFTVVINLNALSLLPPKLDGQKRRNEIKNSKCTSSGKYIKCHKNVLKKKLKRHNKNENCVLQLQRHCAFFFVLLLAVVMMSFGDAGGIIEESHFPHYSNRNNESLLGFQVNGGIQHNRHKPLQNFHLGKTMMTKHKIRHLRKDKDKSEFKRGKYTMREIVMKRVEHSYPCRLVQSAVKVTFPGMKKHVLVSFMGYKEPDLMHVMRCKGVCPGPSVSPVACVPTKRRLKKVAMHLKAQYIGDKAEDKYREVVLEEHEECGCQCLTVTSAHCMEPHLFNNDSCSCTCDSSPYKRDQLHCASFSDHKWDPLTCSCRNKDERIMGNNAQNNQNSQKKNTEVVGSRPGHDIEDLIVFPGCLEGENCHNSNYGPVAHDKHGIAVMQPNYTVTDYIIDSSWFAITVFVLLAIVFASTTFYYWRKSRRMAKTLLHEQDEQNNDDTQNENSLKDGGNRKKNFTIVDC